ncbi:MAG: hypothetical protein AAF402_02290 [Pseudomonadota bacterium]
MSVVFTAIRLHACTVALASMLLVPASWGQDVAQQLEIAAREGNRVAAYNLWAVLRKSQDTHKRGLAELWLEDAASSGYAQAQLKLAAQILETAFTPRKNFARIEQAITWLRLAGQQGSTDARYNLAWIGLNVIGASVTRNEAVGFLESLEASGSTQASFALKAVRTGSLGDVPGLIFPDNSPKAMLPFKSSIVYPSVDFFGGAGTVQALGALPRNTRVEILREHNNRLEVRGLDGVPMWIRGDEVSLESAAAVVSGIRGTLFSVPDSTSSSISIVSKDELLPVLGRKSGWLRVLSPNRVSVWIKKDPRFFEKPEIKEVAVKRAKSGSLLQMQSVAAASGAESGSAEIESSRQSASLQNAENLFQADRRYKVLERPEPDANLVGTIEAGEYIQFLKRDGVVGEILSEGRLGGWIVSRFVDVSGDSGTVTGDRVRIRAAPGTGEDATIIREVNSGSRFKLIERRGDWLRIELGNTLGKGIEL